jgi:hypothetical protein
MGRQLRGSALICSVCDDHCGLSFRWNGEAYPCYRRPSEECRIGALQARIAHLRFLVMSTVTLGVGCVVIDENFNKSPYANKKTGAINT